MPEQAMIEPETQSHVTSIARCANESAVNAQLCADVWRNIPEGSGIGAGTWKALQVYWQTFRGGPPPAEFEQVVLNWPEDQLRWLRGTMVQYTSCEGIHLRIADIHRVNTVDDGQDWKLELTVSHADDLVQIKVYYPWDALTGDPIWP